MVSTNRFLLQHAAHNAYNNFVHSIGELDLCRNLARIAASVCNTRLDVLGRENESKLEKGMIVLLIKAAAHPAVHVCAISLPSLNRLVSIIPELAEELLPILQRRAIIPHGLRDGHLSLDASDICGVNFHEFQNFRENVLADALVACWKTFADQFMESCTSAVEEFCSGTSLPIDVSLQLEAALFCLEKVAGEVKNYSHIKRVFLALSTRTRDICISPLTRLRMSRFLGVVSCNYSLTLILFPQLTKCSSCISVCCRCGRERRVRCRIQSSDILSSRVSVTRRGDARKLRISRFVRDGSS